MWNRETLEAIVLGIVQGLTEFLPISSSAHLILFPWVLGWEPMGLTFDVMVHVGTLGAVVLYFRKDIQRLTTDSLRLIRGDDPVSELSRPLLPAILLGTLPAVVFGLLAYDLIEQTLRHPVVTVVTLSGFGLLLGAADRTGSQSRDISGIRPRDGLLIGLAQALALMPGVSRSGVTITAALLLGLTRRDSARFSFLLGTPVIAMAGAKSMLDLWQAPAGEAVSAAALVWGMIFSFVSGFLCIKYFLRFLRTGTYLSFVVYRLLLAGFILFLLLS